jgi:hypothetical protein
LAFLRPPELETEHLLRFRLSGSDSTVRIHSFLKRNDLNRWRFQSPRFKTRTELIGDLPHLLRRQSITVNSKQPGEVVIKVDEVESNLGITSA